MTHFVEHLGGVVYDGIWVGEGSRIANTDGMRQARGVASRAGLVLGERAVRGAESQRQCQRFAAIADLRAGVHVEQPDIFQQRTGAVANRVHDALGRH